MLRNLRGLSRRESERCRRCRPEEASYDKTTKNCAKSLLKMCSCLTCFLSHCDPLLTNVKYAVMLSYFPGKGKLQEPNRCLKGWSLKGQVWDTAAWSPDKERENHGFHTKIQRRLQGSGKLRAVISLIIVRDRVLFSWSLPSHTYNLRKNNLVNDWKLRTRNSYSQQSSSITQEKVRHTSA